METKYLASTQKTGDEIFCFDGNAVGISLADYWSWAYSDLANNTERGKLAEFIVASALGATERITSVWDSFDLLYMDKGIEVKSAAYLQSWYQEKESYIEFAVRPTLGMIGNTGAYDNDRKRQSDVYVFCFLKHKDKLTLNPQDLDQWEFYIVPTAMLDRLIPTQKHIALSFFRKNGIHPCQYSEIRSRVELAISNEVI